MSAQSADPVPAVVNSPFLPDLRISTSQPRLFSSARQSKPLAPNDQRSANSFTIRTSKKCTHNSFRIRRSKNKGLKVLYNPQIRKKRGEGGKLLTRTVSNNLASTARIEPVISRRRDVSACSLTRQPVPLMDTLPRTEIVAPGTNCVIPTYYRQNRWRRACSHNPFSTKPLNWSEGLL